MRKLHLGLLVLLTMVVWSARAEDKATGTWKWKQSFGGNDIETVLKLKQDGDKVTGSISGFQGAENNIEDGKVDGDKVTFKVTREFGGNKTVTNYTCTISGDSIKVKAETAREFEGKKSKE
jgi:hypothetical protein